VEPASEDLMSGLRDIGGTMTSEMAENARQDVRSSIATNPCSKSADGRHPTRCRRFPCESAKPETFLMNICDACLNFNLISHLCLGCRQVLVAIPCC